MSSLKQITVLLFHLISLSLTLGNRNYDCSYTQGNYTADSPYKANLDELLSYIASNTQINYGFYSFSMGKEPDQVNVIALCRGDLSISNCQRCLNSSIQQVKELCPNEKEAIFWYDTCMLRYTNRTIFGTMEENPGHYDCDPVNASDPSLLWEKAAELLTVLQDQASKGDLQRKFAIGEANVTMLLKVYGMVQCTPDLSEIDCFNCLQSTIGYMQQHCYGKQGATDVEPSCNVKFGVNRFYGLDYAPTIMPSPPSPQSVPSSTPDARKDEYIALLCF